MSVLTTLVQRELKLARAQLSEIPGPLARVAERHVYEALKNVDTMRRLEDRKHVLGDRPDPADDTTREGVAW